MVRCFASTFVARSVARSSVRDEAAGCVVSGFSGCISSLGLWQDDLFRDVFHGYSSAAVSSNL